MSDQLPTWLMQATAGRGRSIPSPRSGIVRPGDLRLIGGADLRRIVLVVDLDRDAGIASVVLTHTDYELCTDRDVLLTPEETGLPFALAVETDVVAPVSLAALADGRLSSIEFDVALLRLATQSGVMPTELVPRSGVPLRGRSDARWGLRAGEAEEIGRIAAAEFEPAGTAAVALATVARLLSALGPPDATGSDVPVAAGDLMQLAGRLIAYSRARVWFPRAVRDQLAAPGALALLDPTVRRAIHPCMHYA